MLKWESMVLCINLMWPLQLIPLDGGVVGGEVEEEQFQGAGGPTDQRHDSFDQPPTYNQKWEDEEDDWEAEQREQGGTYTCTRF